MIKIRLFQRFKSNAYAKPIGRKIKIKTEQSIRRNLGIKKENNVSPNQQKKKNANKIDASEAFTQQKKKLVDSLTNLKKENQKLTFDFKKKSDECVTLKCDNENLAREASNMMTKLNRLEADLSKAKSELAQK